MNARRTVVVGVDGSPQALRAVRWAVPEARRRQAVLQLVTALAWTEDPLDELPGLGQAPYGQYLREAAEKGLAAAADVAAEVDPDVPVERELVLGFPAGVLLERSQTAELLVVGDHGRGRIASAVAGSVAVSVAARSACPVVVVRGAIPDGALPVVVGIDGTPLSEAAIPFAFDAAAARHVPLVAVHTWLDEINDPALARAGRLADRGRPGRGGPGRAPRRVGGEVPGRARAAPGRPRTRRARAARPGGAGAARRRRLPWARRDRGAAARLGQQRPGARGGLPCRDRPLHHDHRGAAPPRTPLEHEEDTMQAQDLMIRTVVTVRPHMPVGAAALLLVSRGVTSAPVVTAEGVLRGMVSEVDLLRAQPVPDALTTTPECSATAADVMTPEPVTVRPTDDLADVAAVLLDHGVRAAPVVEGERLVGIISRHDILSFVARQQPTTAHGVRPAAAAS